jgi:ABC-type nickel/cobalt efflux system permease component RcnA
VKSTAQWMLLDSLHQERGLLDMFDLVLWASGVFSQDVFSYPPPVSLSPPGSHMQSYMHAHTHTHTYTHTHTHTHTHTLAEIKTRQLCISEVTLNF